MTEDELYFWIDERQLALVPDRIIDNPDLIWSEESHTD